MGVRLTDLNSTVIESQVGIRGEFVFPKTFIGDIFQDETAFRGTNDLYGYAISISGDWMAVGAPGQSEHQGSIVTRAGAVYLYHRTITGWEQTQKIAAPFSRGVDFNFGYSVDITGDLLIVGSPTDTRDAISNNDASETTVKSGAAFIFRRSSEMEWSFVKKILPPDRSLDDAFGSSVSINSGLAVIGATGQDYVGVNASFPISQAGAVYLFEEDNDNWSFVKKLSGFADARAIGDDFGYSIARISGLLVVGCPYRDFDGNVENYLPDSGLVYVFERQNDQWVERSRLTAPVRNEGALFGYRVVATDTRLYVSAPGNPSAIYGYEEDNGQFTLVTTINGTSPASRLGDILVSDRTAIATVNHEPVIAGTILDGVGFESMPFQSTNGQTLTSAGTTSQSTDAMIGWASARINDGYLSFTTTLSTNTYTVNGYFKRQSLGVGTSQVFRILGGGGWAFFTGNNLVGLVGKGGNTATATAPFTISNNTWYQFTVVCTATATVLKINGIPVITTVPYGSVTNPTIHLGNDPIASSTTFNGWIDGITIGTDLHVSQGSVLVIGTEQSSITDLNGEGLPGTVSLGLWEDMLLIGCPQADTDSDNRNPLSQAGAVYRFKKNTQWDFVEKITPMGNDRNADDAFATSVSYADNWLVVGAPGQDYTPAGREYLASAGAIYAWYREGTVWQFRSKFTAPDRAAGDEFGYRVVTGKGIAAVSSKSATDAMNANPVSQAGAVYVIDLASNTLLSKLVGFGLNGRAPNALFGSVVAIGDRIFVGEPGHRYDADGNNPQVNSGAVWVFERDGTAIQKITIPQRYPGEEAAFGHSVAVRDNRLLIGSPGHRRDLDETNILADAGAAWLFVQQGETYVFDRKLVGLGNDRNPFDHYGHAVTGDGENVIVSAPDHDFDANSRNYLSSSGAVYVWSKLATWQSTAKLTAVDRRSDVRFGAAVKMKGDLLAVISQKSPHESSRHTFATPATPEIGTISTIGAGAAASGLSLYGNGSLALNGSATAYLKMTGGNQTITGDFTMSIVCRFSSFNPLNVIVSRWSHGLAYNWALLYDDTSGQLRFTSTTGTLPSAVSVNADWQPNTDTWYQLTVTRRNSILQLSVDGVQIASVSHTIPIANTHSTITFGYSTYGQSYGKAEGFNGYLEDWIFLNGESYAFQSPYKPAGASLHVFERVLGVWNPTAFLSLPSWSDDGRIAVSRDAIAVTDPTVAGNTGACFVYRRNPDWQYHGTLTGDPQRGGGVAGGWYGKSVDIRDDMLVVGESQNTTDRFGQNPIANAGAAWLYQWTGGGYTLLEKITTQSVTRHQNDAFGHAVTADAGWLVVTAPSHGYTDTGSFVESSGAAYVWQWAGDEWSYVQKLISPTRMINGHFGISAALAGDDLFIGETTPAGQTTKLLWDFDQETVSDIRYPLTIIGTPTISSAKFRYGVSSLQLNATSSVTYPVGVIGPKATIEFHVNTAATNGTVAGQWNGGTGSWRIDLASGALTAYYIDGGLKSIAGPVINDGQWHHVALVKDNTSLMLFVDGKLIQRITVVNAMIGLSGVNFALGTGSAAGNILAWYDNISVTNGVRYTNAFTVSRTRSCRDTFNFVHHWRKTGSSFALVETINPSDKSDDELFGATVATNGNILLIGSPHATVSTISQAGKVRRYVKSGETFSYQSTLLADVPGDGYHFGSSLYVDSSVMIIGSSGNTTDASNGGIAVNQSGAIYIWEGETFVQKMTADMIDRDSGDQFAYSMASSGDLLIIGAPGHRYTEDRLAPLTNAGAVWIYRWSGTAWVMEEKITSPARSSERFGHSVAIDGDNLVVGAPYADDRGAAYHFQGPSWTLINTLLPSEPLDEDDMFGWDVSVSGNDIIATAPYRGAGVVYAFTVGNPIGEAIIPTGINAREEGDRFGYSAVVRDGWLVASAPLHGWDVDGTNYATEAGAAWIWEKTTSWVQREKIVAYGNSKADGEKFGTAISISGDRMAVGVPNHDYDSIVELSGRDAERNHLPNAGAVFLYRYISGWQFERKITPTVRHEGDEFGSSVCLNGTTLIVGGPGHQFDEMGGSAIERAGAAWIFEGEDFTETKKLIPTGLNARNAYDEFGYAVAVDGLKAVVSSPRHAWDENGENRRECSGAVWCYDRGTEWTQTTKLAPRSSIPYPPSGMSHWWAPSDLSTVAMSNLTLSFIENRLRSGQAFTSVGIRPIFFGFTETSTRLLVDTNLYVDRRLQMAVDETVMEEMTISIAIDLRAGTQIFHGPLAIEFMTGDSGNSPNRMDVVIGAARLPFTLPNISAMDQGRRILTITSNGLLNGIRLFVDGVEATPTAAPATSSAFVLSPSTNRLRIMNFAGDIGEMIFYDRELSDLEREQLITYMNKWK